jgi:hypothetical protein
LSIRAAFYYPWFPETWTAGGKPVHGTPSIGKYKSELGIFQGHVVMMRYARISVGIFSWWGSSSPYDVRVPDLLRAAEGTPFKWAAYHEQEGFGNPTVEGLKADLDYLKKYFSHPNYLKRNGKPVVFAYGDGSDDASMCTRWGQAAGQSVYYGLKVFDGYKAAQPQPSMWYQYGPDKGYQDFLPWSVTVSPGFWFAPDATARLVRDPNRFEADVTRMTDGHAQWEFITTFNEWGEGTAVEPEVSRGTVELDILRRHKPG